MWCFNPRVGKWDMILILEVGWIMSHDSLPRLGWIVARRLLNFIWCKMPLFRAIFTLILLEILPPSAHRTHSLGKKSPAKNLRESPEMKSASSLFLSGIIYVSPLCARATPAKGIMEGDPNPVFVTVCPLGNTQHWAVVQLWKFWPEMA